MRLRTLPLSLAGVVCGALMAWGDSARPSAATVIFLLLTTVCLQVLSNMSNELGDYLSGTDGDGREGPRYSLAEGGLSVKQLRRLIGLFAVLCCVFGLAMVIASFGTLLAIEPVALVLLGAAAVWAAMHYTLGAHPYGYRGWGDFFVFIFFGLVSGGGSYYVVTHCLPTWQVWLMAAAIGFFSIGVLNVNNIRDMASDAGIRTTIPLRIGERRAKIYHTLLIVAGWACLLAATFFTFRWSAWLPWLYVATLPAYIVHLHGVWHRSGRKLDPMLPLLVMSTFVLAILFGIGFCLS